MVSTTDDKKVGIDDLQIRSFPRHHWNTDVTTEHNYAPEMMFTSQGDFGGLRSVIVSLSE